MANKKKRCANCKRYSPVDDMVTTPLQSFCDRDCAVRYAIANQAKGKKIKHRAQKQKLKSNDKALRMKEAQKAFNAYIRKRDEKEPCISCQRHHEGQYHAGHFKTTAARPDLRFNEDNCHKQCAPCNNHLSGNIGQYIAHLTNKIGQERLELLALDKQVKYTCQELKEIELYYKEKLKKLN